MEKSSLDIISSFVVKKKVGLLDYDKNHNHDYLVNIVITII